MKSRIPSILIALAMVAGIAQAADEIAFINLQDVFKQYYKTKLAQDQIREQLDDIKVERDGMVAEIEVIREEIEDLRTAARDETLNVEVRAGKRDQLEERLVTLQKKEQEMTEFEKLRVEQVEAQNQRMTTKLFDEIQDAINNHANMKGYAAVIDRSAQSRIGTDIVLYSTARLDITAQVLEILNAGRITEAVEGATSNGAGE